MADLGIIENANTIDAIDAHSLDKDAKTVNAPKGGAKHDLSDDAWSILPPGERDPTITMAHERVAKMAADLETAQKNAEVQKAKAEKCVREAEAANQRVASAKEGLASATADEVARQEEQRKVLEASVAAATDAVDDAATASRALDTALASTKPTVVEKMCIGLYGNVFAACPARPDNTCPAQLSAECTTFPDVPCPASARTAR